MLTKAFGTEENAILVADLLAYDFPEFERRYLAHRPILTVGQVGLTLDQLELLLRSLTEREMGWTFQHRYEGDEIVKAFGAYSYRDLLRRYQKGEAQLRIDLETLLARARAE